MSTSSSYQRCVRLGPYATYEEAARACQSSSSASDGDDGMSRHDAEDGDGAPLMAARPANFTTAAAPARRTPDRFPLALCQYEGKVSEYAGCGCEDRHIRFCENPYQGGTDPDGRAVPDIDRVTRAYLPDWDMPNCEKCPYKKAPQ